jgi:PAS domain S-box-containing protein
MRQRRKAEKQIRQLSTALQQSPVSVIITDPDTRIQYVNDCFARFSGMEANDLIGVTPFEITRGQVPLNEYKDLWDNVKKGEIWKGELEYLKRDGQKVWLSITVSPVLDDTHGISNFVAIMEEITDRKIAEQTLRRAKEEAEKSDHLKSAFLANMSHEIRTPMNAILGFSSLLKEGDLDHEQSNYYVDIINSKGRDLLRIISDIIDISRIEAGDLYIKMEPVEIYPFIREIFREFKEDTQVQTRSNLQFRLKIHEPEIPLIVNTDPARLKQVLVNLIQNALKFTPDGFVELGFKLKKDNDIHFYIKDSGVGIPEDKVKIIFERFRQLDESHTREYGGTGLGLAICKNLLDLMGTELSVKTTEGRGSEFSFRMKYISTQSTKQPQPAEETEIIPILDLEGRKILIAEDDGSSYLYLESLLSRYSAEIIWAKNGIQAVDMVKRNKDIDLVLMDIRMPDMNGIEATRIIRNKHPDLPIIAQTAYAQVKDRNLALENGCTDYLSKPISAVKLVKLLSRYIGKGD